MKYICIKKFNVDKFDDNNNYTGELDTVEPGEVFYFIHNDNKSTNTSIRLENDDKWLEISEYEFLHYFEEFNEDDF